MKSENSETSEQHVLIPKLTDKLDLRRGEANVALSNLRINQTWKNIKSAYINNKFKISIQHGKINMNYQMGNQIFRFYQIFKIILSIFSKKHNEKIDNPSIKIHLNKIESRITFKIKTGDYVQEVLTPETMKLL